MNLTDMIHDYLSDDPEQHLRGGKIVNLYVDERKDGDFQVDVNYLDSEGEDWFYSDKILKTDVMVWIYSKIKGV